MIAGILSTQTAGAVALIAAFTNANLGKFSVYAILFYILGIVLVLYGLMGTHPVSDRSGHVAEHMFTLQGVEVIILSPEGVGKKITEHDTWWIRVENTHGQSRWIEFDHDVFKQFPIGWHYSPI